jgi:chorismate mutase
MDMAENLDDLRASIDNVDREMISLLKKRADYVKKVGIRKSSVAGSRAFIRSGREAKMLRNLTKAIAGLYNPYAIANIWRNIISSSLDMERKLKITAYAGDDGDYCYWLAREYFASLSVNKSSSDFIDSIINKQADVAVVPNPENHDWWWKLFSFGDDRPKVFAQIPFLERSDCNYSAFAIANVEPEETGEDISLFVVEGDAGNVKVLASHDNYKLVQISGFTKELTGGQYIGSYAVPIKI